jgi:hypothetical protein
MSARNRYHQQVEKLARFLGVPRITMDQDAGWHERASLWREMARLCQLLAWEAEDAAAEAVAVTDPTAAREKDS